MLKDMNIGFIGFGNMASALADGFVRTGAVQPARIGACARDWEKLRRNAEARGIVPLRDAAAVAEFADAVVVAVKPHQVEEVLVPVREALRGKIVVSVVAGYTFGRYERILAEGTPHLSTIPNTPVSVGEGIVVCERRHSLSEEDYARITELLSKIGLVLTVDTELLDIAGTVGGCGPAFVCLFMEALADAAVKHGIVRTDAYRMAGQMVAGTGRLLLESGLHPAQLKDAVCSPGGTTIVGVAELERRRFRGAVLDAIDAIERKE